MSTCVVKRNANKTNISLESNNTYFGRIHFINNNYSWLRPCYIAFTVTSFLLLFSVANCHGSWRDHAPLITALPITVDATKGERSQGIPCTIGGN